MNKRRSGGIRRIFLSRNGTERMGEIQMELKTRGGEKAFQQLRDGRGRAFLFCRLGSVFLTAALFAGLCGCGQGAALAVGKKSEKGYSLPEIMIIAATEKNRYEKVCTAQIWDAPVGEDAGTFEDYLKGEIRSFLEEVKAMTLLAKEKEISLSAEERADMSEAAEEYYSLLTEEDIRYMGTEPEDVRTMFEDYCLAEKLVGELTGDLNLEVSDSEAKVIQIEQAETSDQQAAEALAAAASQEGADFSTCADELGITVKERALGRGEETEEIEEAAFALMDGQTSAVISQGEMYYVIHCLEDYDTEATDERKKLIFEERKKRAFQDIYADFRENLEITYTDSLWEDLDLTSGSFGQAADFFEIYEKYTR